MNPKAFTLIEILIVVAIVGILSGIVVVSMSDSQEKARIAKIKGFSDSLRSSMLTSLVLEFKFDEGEGDNLTDNWKGNEGTRYNALWYSADNCIFENCLYFDGAGDYVEINDNNLLDEVFGTEEFTLEAWVYPQDWVNYRGIINKRQSNYYSASPGGLFSDISGIRFIIGTGNEAESTNTTGYKPSLNQWHHIVAVADGSNMYLYIDNELRDSSSITLNPPQNNDPLSIGSFYSNSRSFKGFIDEVRIYSNSVDTAYIQKEYTIGLYKLFKKGLINKNEYQKRICLNN